MAKEGFPVWENWALRHVAIGLGEAKLDAAGWPAQARANDWVPEAPLKSNGHDHTPKVEEPRLLAEHEFDDRDAHLATYDEEPERDAEQPDGGGSRNGKAKSSGNKIKAAIDDTVDMPPLEEFTGKATGRGTWSSASDDSTRSSDRHSLTAEEWLARDLAPVDCLVGDWLTTTSRILLAAETGIGKTNLAMALAIHLAAGIDFLHWRIPQPRRVLYVDGEMSRRLLKQRVGDAVRRIGGVLPPGFFLLSHEDVENFRPLNTEEGQRFICEEIARVGAECVMFDNIMALIVGDMKEEESWRQTLPLVDQLTKKCVGQLWLHHTGHDTDRSYGTKTREWRMDTVILGKKVERPDSDVSFALEFRKARERTPQNRRDFSDVTVALVNDKWVGNLAPKAAIGNPSPEGKKFMQALQNVFTQKKTVPFQEWKAVTMGDWRQECVTQGLLDESKKPNSLRAAFSKYRVQLIACNLIACNGDHVWIVHTPRLADNRNLAVLAAAAAGMGTCCSPFLPPGQSATIWGPP